MAYITTADFAEYIHSASSEYDSDDEARWTGFISAATALIETFTARTFEATATTGTSDAPVTRYFDADKDVDGLELFFNGDICEITTVTNGDSDSTTVGSSDYFTNPRNITPYYSIKLRGSSGISWEYVDDTENAIKIAGVWAYSKTPPNDVKQACKRLVKWLEDQRTTPDLDRPLLAGDGSVILPSRLPADVQAILTPYRRTRLGAV